MDDKHQKHPIAVVSERTGLSQDVLRVWERRYRAVEPTRSSDGHRVYSDADIERLKLLAAATSAGRSIGQIARLPTRELSQMVADDTAERAERSSARAEARGSAPNATSVVERAATLTAAMDGTELEHVLRRAITQLGVTAFIEDVATPLLRRIGDDWHAGRASIAHEHLASATVHDILVETMRSIARQSAGATVLVATPSGERHAIGAALVGAAAASEGWRVVYLGADMPASEIAAAALAAKARVVALSIIYLHDRARTLAELRSLRALLPPPVVVVVGGRAAGALADDLLPLGIRVGTSSSDLHATLGDAAESARGAA